MSLELYCASNLVRLAHSPLKIFSKATYPKNGHTRAKTRDDRHRASLPPSLQNCSSCSASTSWPHSVPPRFLLARTRSLDQTNYTLRDTLPYVYKGHMKYLLLRSITHFSVNDLSPTEHKHSSPPGA